MGKNERFEIVGTGKFKTVGGMTKYEIGQTGSGLLIVWPGPGEETRCMRTGTPSGVRPEETIEVCEWRRVEGDVQEEGAPVEPQTTACDAVSDAEVENQSPGYDNYNDPDMREIIYHTIQLRERCIAKKLPRDLVFNGVAWDADQATNEAYKAGYERCKQDVLGRMK